MAQIQNAHLIRRAAMASIATALILLVAKTFAWAASDSASILSSLLDSLMDITASVVNFFAIRYALTPADDDHPFGHTKAEGLAALLQSGFILGSAGMLLLHVSERLINPRPIDDVGLGIGVMAFSTIATITLVMYQRWVAARTSSLAIKADSAHYLGDILTSAAVVLALIASKMEVYWLDPLVAVLIAVVLIWSAVGILRESFRILMDSAMAEEDEKTIIDMITATQGIHGFHDLRTRQSGVLQFIQFHIDMNGQQSLRQAHDIGDALEHRIRDRFPQAEVIVHYDPV
ncbi:MAG: divalent metal cation transporter FieF [Oceanospirillaceae bacterium]|nr:divalent metal cation transporter FieF [Oceanospirillaceae bacterium]MAR01617.1 divalent metal cation transporter FieF [Oceanospirillaceae bacterium]|tara:strand:- start:218 stop:1084 length:867 start_codon:yes stop_codon:yes gene_type:complete